MKKRRSIMITGSVALLAILGLLSFLLTRMDLTNDEALWLSQRPIEEIRGISATDMAEQNELALSTDGKEWTMRSGEPVKQERVAPLLSTLGYLKAAYKVEDGDTSSLAQYGLENPKVTLNVEYENDDIQTWQLGASQGNKGTYLKSANDDSIYLVDEVRAEVMLTAVKKFLEVPLDQVDFNKINGIHITSPSQGEIRLNRSEAPRSGGDFFWRIFAPFSSNANKEILDEIVSQMSEEGWIKRVGDEGEYGFDDTNPKILSFFDIYDRQLKITFGDISEEGAVYCRIDGLSGVYVMNAEILSVFDIDPKDLVDLTVYYYEVSSISEFKFTWKGQERSFRSVWEDIESGKQGQRFSIDGQTISGGDYHAFANALTSIQGKGLYLDGESGLGDIVGSMYFKRLSFPYEETIDFRSINGSPGYVAVDYGGKSIVYVEDEKIESIMEDAVALAAPR